MEKKDSAPPSRFPGASASSADRSANEPSPSSPNSPRRAAFSSGEDDSPKAPAKFRSLKDIYADLDRRSLKFRIKVPPGFNFDSPTTAKGSGADRHGDSLKLRSKTPPGFDIRSLRAQPSTDSSPGVQETESAPPSLHYREMVDNVLEDYLKQEVVQDDYKACLRAGIAGHVGSRPGPSGLRQPSRPPTGPNKGPGRKAPGSASGSSKQPKNARALLSQEGRGGSDNPAAIGGPAGSRSGTGEPSQATSERSFNKPGRWIERKLDCGKLLRIKLSESRSKPPDKPSNRESENE
ncbi:hypothetical protein COCNU_scaffold005650G000050 [Cocos nucifera]|nr:hypothetical protein [Cocos nucifera]